MLTRTADDELLISYSFYFIRNLRRFTGDSLQVKMMSTISDLISTVFDYFHFLNNN